MDQTPTADELNALTRTIIGAAIKVHRALGPGLLESTYLACLVSELRQARLRVETQKPIPLVYGDVRVPCAYRADLLVEGQVIVELKAIEATTPIHARQLQTYTQLADCRVGLLLNFGAATLRDGIVRVVNRFPGPHPPLE
jgi:GxxExxY protein